MNSHAFIARHLPAWAGLLMPLAFAAACAPTSDFQQVQDQQFEIRAMVASNQQSIQALDQRLRRLEDQFQELQHDSGRGPSNAALARRVSRLEAALNLQRNGVNPAANAANVAPGLGAAPGIPAAGLPPGEGAQAPGATAPDNPVPPTAGTVPPGANLNAAGPLNEPAAGGGGEEMAAVPPAPTAPAPAVPSPWHQELSRAQAAAQSDNSTSGKLY